MKNFLILLLFIFLYNCSKPKTVLICGDHICVNKTEAEQYFQENLSIEVKIIDDKRKEKINLVELNLKNNADEEKQIRVENKQNTNKEVKVLTNEEIDKIKKEIKNKSKNKKSVKKIKKNNVKKENLKTNTNKKNYEIDSHKSSKKNANNQRKEVVDICTIIEKCSIDAISKYLIKQGNKKDFPDITTRE